MKLLPVAFMVLVFSCQSSELSLQDTAVSQDYYEIGLDYANVKKNDKAISYFKKALAKNPNFEAARYNLSLVLAKNGDFVEALSFIEQLKDNNDKVLELKAYLFVQVNRKNEAQTLYQDLITRNPGAFRLFFNLAKISENKELSVHSIDEAIKLKPDDLMLLATKAELLVKFADLDGAIETYQTILNKDTNNNEARFNLAKAFFGAKRFEEALDLFKELNQKNKYEKKYLVSYIQTQIALGQTDEQILGNVEDLVKNFTLKDDEIQEFRKGLGSKLQLKFDALIKNKPKTDQAPPDPAVIPK